MKIENKTYVLAITPSFIPSAIIGVAAALNNLKNKDMINFKMLGTNRVTHKDVEAADVLVCIRCRLKKELDMVEIAKKFNKYVIYYLDDDLMSCSYNEETKNIMQSIMKHANQLWTPSKNIKRKYENFFDKASVIDAPALLLDENEQIEYNINNDKVIIGFSGRAFRSHSLENLLKKPIKIIKNKYKEKVQIEFFGPQPLSLIEYGVKHIQYTRNYDEYIKIMKSRKWDIGVAPLEDIKFHHYKYYNKFLEYGSIRAAGIYSNIQPYTDIVIDKQNGVLVNNTCEEWIEAFEYLIQNPEQRKRIQKQAYTQLENKFNLDYITNMVIRNIPEILNTNR